MNSFLMSWKKSLKDVFDWKNVILKSIIGKFTTKNFQTVTAKFSFQSQNKRSFIIYDRQSSSTSLLSKWIWKL